MNETIGKNDTAVISGVRVIIMCKAPLEGRVKTRLMTVYSAAEAAAIHRAMATMVIERALRLFIDVRVAADDLNHPFFARFAAPLVAQGEGNLGKRMGRLMQAAFADGASSVLFLGTDSPHMPDARLVEAAAALETHDTVIGPVEDGGYELIALKTDQPVFSDVIWSSAPVLDQTVSNIHRLGLSCKLLASGFDIDTPEDLARAQASGWCWQADGT
ncbi:MAG: TIGR04282 family arsenosugar biosynthesis glycosyltransferase [Mariprofundaceae bacterium]|nr:TIGR04282 family arsenosugar biosynthesis glycosyltransferase [Mariprofundaceae bacterium]